MIHNGRIREDGNNQAISGGISWLSSTNKRVNQDGHGR